MTTSPPLDVCAVYASLLSNGLAEDVGHDVAQSPVPTRYIAPFRRVSHGILLRMDDRLHIPILQATIWPN